MTEQEELQLVSLAGDKLSEVMEGIPHGSALLMLFPDHRRMHAVSNLGDADKMKALINMYLNGLPQSFESVWLLLRCRQVDGVSVESIVGAFATKEMAQMRIDELEPQEDTSHTIEEQKVQVKL